MAYVVPQVLVHQEFNIVPAELADALRAHISGGHAQLIRYDEDDEKILAGLGEYDPVSDASYSWPEREPGGVIDDDYVKVFVDDALLEYFTDLIGADATITAAAGATNKIAAAAGLNFQTANGFARHADLLDRDVQLGDAVYIRGVVDSEAIELWSYVRGFDAAVVAATVGDATSDAANVAGQAASITGVMTAGTANCLELTLDAASYNGLVDGDVNDVYTVTVTKGSTAGDLTTAELRITSASGNDDVAAVAPAAVGALREVGTRALELGFSVGGAGSSCSGADPETAEDLIVGQTWEVTVAEEHEEPKAISGGTYTGDADTTYVVEVTRGGLFADADLTRRPQITVTTTHGTDISGPTGITADNTATVIGSKGVTIQFYGTGSASSVSSGNLIERDEVTGLRKGDRYYVVVTAEAAGAVQTLELGHDLGDLADAPDLDLKLYIKKDIEVTRNRDGFAPLVNFESSDTELIIKSGVVAYDASLTAGGTPVALDVVGGTLYVEYRAWLPNLSTAVGTISDVGDLNDVISGALHPDNPLKWGVYYALINSNGTAVKFTSVADPDDDDSWLEVLSLLIGRDDVYNLVPLTRDATVLNAYAGHVTGQSSAEAGRWRGLFVNLEAAATAAVVDSTTNADAVVLATIADDPNTTGTQYTLLSADDGDFLTNNVAPGDIVRTQFTSDGFGNESYSEYVVDAILSEQSLRLAAGPDVAISVAAKMEIWHDNNKTEVAAQVALDAGSYGNRRVVAVWPDTIDSGDHVMQGYHLCAALAGLRSGVVPHQGLTNVEILGFDNVSRSTTYFNATNLNTLVDSGTWVVTQDQNGNVHTRHAVTTGDTDDINQREEMVRTNVDAMSYVFLNRLAPYIGKANVTPGTLSVLRVELDSIIDFLKTNGYVASLGGQLIDGEITSLRAHALLPDRIVAVLNLTIPYALNNIEVHLVV
jgi:hypothetical protein